VARPTRWRDWDRLPLQFQPVRVTVDTYACTTLAVSGTTLAWICVDLNRAPHSQQVSPSVRQGPSVGVGGGQLLSAFTVRKRSRQRSLWRDCWQL